MHSMVDLTAEDEGEVSELYYINSSITHPWCRRLQLWKAGLDYEGRLETRIGRARIIKGGDSNRRGLSLLDFLFQNMYFLFNL